MKTSLYQKCIDENRPSLLAEWATEKNDPLTPWNVSYGSRVRVWWRCEKGHEWEAPVYTRWGGHGCPYCSGKKLQKGFNDLATKNPTLAAEWHPTKNGTLTPDCVFSNSTKTVWWQCEKGHEWQSTVNARTQGAGCPICGSRKLQPGYNDLATKNPALAKQWHPTKNGTLTPEQVFPGSSRRVWWQCGHGHEWQATIASRAKDGNGCPVCAGKKVVPGENDLVTLAPEIAAEWHPTKNEGLRPEQIHPHSPRGVWWRCEKGHEWKAAVSARVLQKSGCPICANKTVQAGENDLATLAPEIAAEWDPTKNGGLTPRDVGPGSHVRVWWRCEKGHEWRAQVQTRVKRGSGCPVCAGKTVIPGENDLATYAPALAAEWHPTKNNDLTPDQVRPQSNRHVWWQCEKGHEWRAAINSRVSKGNACPYCGSRRLMQGYNDLATLEPRVAAQWDPELNGALTPDMVMPGSHRKVWWRCADGHVWQTYVFSRTGNQRSGCPVCAGVVGKKRLARMQALEASVRMSLANRQRMMPERYIPAPAAP